MKKKLLSGLFALALLATTAVGVAESKKSEVAMSDLAMANVEALANGESEGGERIICYRKIEGFQGFPMEDKTWCNECRARPASSWSDKSECSK